MTTPQGDKPIQVLLVEDNPADVRLTEETLKGSHHDVRLSVAEDGEVAMARLRREGEHADSPRPDLMLLDLNLPGKDGAQVLEEMNADPELATIPVMILTGTEAQQSLLESFNIPPSRYCRKPIDLERFHRALGQLGLFSRQPISLSPAGTEPAAAQPSVSDGPKKKWWWPFG